MADLEDSVSLSRWRPFAKRANNPVHAGPRGLQSLSTLPDLHGARLLLAGASNTGLNDPGQHTARTLVLIAVSLSQARQTLDRLAMVRALEEMADRTQAAFAAAQEVLQQRHEATRKRKPARGRRRK